MHLLSLILHPPSPPPTGPTHAQSIICSLSTQRVQVSDGQSYDLWPLVQHTTRPCYVTRSHEHHSAIKNHFVTIINCLATWSSQTHKIYAYTPMPLRWITNLISLFPYNYITLPCYHWIWWQRFMQTFEVSTTDNKAAWTRQKAVEHAEAPIRNRAVRSIGPYSS